VNERVAGIAAMSCAALLLAGCGGSTGPGASAGPAAHVKITLSDGGCAPQPASVPSGATTFDVTNSGSAKVTEAELMRDGRIIGEKESLTPGVSGSFSLRLEPGRYGIYCPGATRDTWPFTVTPGKAGGGAATDPQLAQATRAYHDYVISEVDQLASSGKAFTDAVRAGDIGKAKAAYARAREHYETIEPVAESFGDLDPRIDARADGVADSNQWTGFHRIEKALWEENTLAGMAPLADQLDADIATLRHKVATETYQPAQLANGASELLTEVSTSKVTGEEDRYSHTDLWDFAANVAGAQKVFELLKPALTAKDPALAERIEARFADVNNGLSRYRRGEGWVPYDAVPESQRRQLASLVNALAEPLSKVAGQVV
jgi:iron uptake system component EfeO